SWPLSYRWVSGGGPAASTGRVASRAPNAAPASSPEADALSAPVVIESTRFCAGRTITPDEPGILAVLIPRHSGLADTTEPGAVRPARRRGGTNPAGRLSRL